MRKEAKENRSLELARVQGYHEGGCWTNREEYAFQGFKKLFLLSSDRQIPLVMQDGVSKRADGKPIKGFGLEIETECFTIDNPAVLAEVYDKIIFPQFPEGLFKMQHDGSLDGSSSAECITQVMTKAAVRNQYPAFKAMFNTYFEAFGISAARTGNCGMHVNISNGCFGATEETISEAVKKLLYFVNKHYDFCCGLFYRNTNNTTYCGRMREYTTQDGAKNADLHCMSGSHYNCMNYSHFDAGRIEIRLVGGQKNYACFRNTMECVFHLVEAVKRLDWKALDDLSKVFKGCNQYVFDRISSYCLEAGTITSADVEKIRATVKHEDLL